MKESRKIDYTEYYSTKRRPDYITVIAVIFFILMIAFEIYLVAFLPIHIMQDESLTAIRVRDEILTNMDNCRTRMDILKASADTSKLNEGEIELVRNSLDNIARDLRDNSENFSLEELGKAEMLVEKYQVLLDEWGVPRGFARQAEPFRINAAVVTEELDRKKYVDAFEKRVMEK